MRRPETVNGFVAIVYVIPAADGVSNVTAFPNSVAAALKVIVWPDAEENKIAEAKFQEADVDEFAHAPPTVHEPPAFVM